MKHLLHTLEGRLAALPVPMAVQLPAGQQLGAHDPAVTLRFRDRMALVALATGEIGNVGAAIVEGRVALEGGMRDLMAAAAGLLTRDPAREQHHGDHQPLRPQPLPHPTQGAAEVARLLRR